MSAAVLRRNVRAGCHVSAVAASAARAKALLLRRPIGVGLPARISPRRLRIDLNAWSASSSITFPLLAWTWTACGRHAGPCRCRRIRYNRSRASSPSETVHQKVLNSPTTPESNTRNAPSTMWTTPWPVSLVQSPTFRPRERLIVCRTRLLGRVFALEFLHARQAWYR